MSNLHYRLYGGVLEEMFSGLGGEVLLTPFASRLAYSMSAYHARKRDYDKSFNHLGFKNNSAFVSAFWATPF